MKLTNAVLLLAAMVPAQVFDPPTSVTIDGAATQGRFAFRSYTVRAGVTVTYTGAFPIVVECSGAVIIDGKVSVAASGTRPGPGAVGAPGAGAPGVRDYCTIGGASSNAAAGRNLTDPTAIPLVLRGGGSGGDQTTLYPGWFPGTCFSSIASGGTGGGVLTIVADGSILVAGEIDASGSGIGGLGGGAAGAGGAGGGVLLRSYDSLVVSGSVVARGSGGNVAPGGSGVVRLDGYGHAPSVTGTVDPAPVSWTLPVVVEHSAPVTGGSWVVRHLADPGAIVYVAVSDAPDRQATPYGWLEIQLGSALTLGTATMASGLEPFGDLAVPVPPAPWLVGLTFYVQSLNYVSAHAPRYTNSFATTIR